MRQITFALMAGMGLIGCGGPQAAQVAADSAARDIALPIADSTLALNDAASPEPSRVDTVFIERPGPASAPARVPAPKPVVRTQSSRPAAAPVPPPAPAPAPEPAAPAPTPVPRGPARLEAGTAIEATAAKALNSRSNKAGESFSATIGSAVTAEDGRVVIPAGATVTFTIVAIGPATNTAATDGTIELRATGIVVDGESRALDAQVTFVEHSLKGQGVGASEVTKVGVGTAAGAILGRVIGGKTGTVVGAAAGAAAGTAVAVKSADRDLVVAVGARIKLVLKSALVSGS